MESDSLQENATAGTVLTCFNPRSMPPIPVNSETTFILS